MQTTQEQINPTTIKMTLIADEAQLAKAKTTTLKRLGQNMKLPGFRPGKLPLPMVERNADPLALSNEFVEEAFGLMYDQALQSESLRVVGRPKVELQKFVPFTTLEVTAEIEIIGEVKLPDYTKFKLAKPTVEVTDQDVDEVVGNLRTQAAERQQVERAAQKGDQATIDFRGVDTKTGELVKGADGKGYPLMLGSDAFIPGFEANIIGMQPAEEKIFKLTFPKDYGVKALQKRNVTFTVTLHDVHELVKPVVDDAFAATVGPFTSAQELRDNIRTQLHSEKERQSAREFENLLVEMLASQTTVAVPNQLIDEEVEQIVRQARQNVTYRGQTWQEFLEDQDQTEETYAASQREIAEQRVKAGLALSEVANRENLTVTAEEFRARMQQLKTQYTDKQMRAELEKPENARTVLAGMISEKTMAKLTSLCLNKEKI